MLAESWQLPLYSKTKYRELSTVLSLLVPQTPITGSSRQAFFPYAISEHLLTHATDNPAERHIGEVQFDLPVAVVLCTKVA